MAEWSKAHAWRACGSVMAPRVRIPVLPPVIVIADLTLKLRINRLSSAKLSILFAKIKLRLLRLRYYAQIFISLRNFPRIVIAANFYEKQGYQPYSTQFIKKLK